MAAGKQALDICPHENKAFCDEEQEFFKQDAKFGNYVKILQADVGAIVSGSCGSKVSAFSKSSLARVGDSFNKFASDRPLTALKYLGLSFNAAS